MSSRIIKTVLSFIDKIKGFFICFKLYLALVSKDYSEPSLKIKSLKISSSP